MPQCQIAAEASVLYDARRWRLTTEWQRQLGAASEQYSDLLGLHLGLKLIDALVRILYPDCGFCWRFEAPNSFMLSLVHWLPI